MNNNREKIKRVKVRGAALLLFVIFFLAASLIMVLSIGRGVYDDLARYRVLEAGKRSLYGAEAGIEDAIHRHIDADNYSSTETFNFSGVTVNVTRTLYTDYFMFLAEGDANGAVRKSEMELAIGDGASFNFGLQAGNGGILIANNSSVVGNVFSNGTIEGQGSATVFGEIISAGSSGLVDNVYTTGSVYANTILNSEIDGSAYCDSIDNSTVGGSLYCNTVTATIPNPADFPGPADQVVSALPIPDAKVEEWKTNITNTGSTILSTSPECLSGTYVINTNTTLGNVKIECNVEVKKQGAGTTLTLTAPIWISGNLSFSAGPQIVASPSLGTRSVQVIVDNESNRTTSSQITVNQATNFLSSNASSYVLLLSMNNSAEGGGTEKAINIAQSANGQILVYAGHGLVDLGNSITLKEVTAHQIQISNGAQVIYESGLMSLLFTGGPGGGFTVASWHEVE